MSTLKDGGPAFPQTETKNSNIVADEHGQGGMTLRDWFAGQALAGVLASDAVHNAISEVARKTNQGVPPAWAQYAYQIADAMLAERAKERK